MISLDTIIVHFQNTVTKYNLDNLETFENKEKNCNTIIMNINYFYIHLEIGLIKDWASLKIYEKTGNIITSVEDKKEIVFLTFFSFCKNVMYDLCALNYYLEEIEKKLIN